MSDLLVKLYDLPSPVDSASRLREAGFQLRRAIPPDRRAVLRWVAAEFSERWAGEVESAFGSTPVRCHVVTDPSGQPAGFACHDVTFRGFFGPLGVRADCRGHGLGTALLLAGLQSLANCGHAYAVIGCVDDAEFYVRKIGAIVIPDSSPGPYGPWND